MRKLMFVVAASAVMASSAMAAPGFGGSGLSAGGAGHVRADSEPRPLLAFVMGFFSFDVDFAAGGEAPASGSVDNPEECEQAKAARETEKDEARTAATTGPEPMYLAF